MSDRKRLIIISNLYPVPWNPNKASFNRTQFQHLENYYDVTIIVLVGWIEWLRHRKQAKSSENLRYCPYFYFPKVFRILVPLFQYISLCCLLPAIKKLKPSGIFASWGYPDGIAVSMLNWHLKCPLVIKVHGTDINEHLQYSLRTKVINYFFNKAQKIYCVSKNLYHLLKDAGVNANKLNVVYNGVNSQLFKEISIGGSQTSNELVFVGNLIPAKGVVELLSAFFEIAATHSDLALNIIGQGPMLSELERMVKEKKLSNRITFHGSCAQEKVAENIQSSRLLILPSYQEGVPNVVLEAAACGIPVVATDVGGISEVVSKETGILTQAKNVVALQDAIETALNTTWDKNKIIEHSQRFSWQHNCLEVVDMLEGR